jgi:hypothetical protein
LSVVFGYPGPGFLQKGRYMLSSLVRKLDESRTVIRRSYATRSIAALMMSFPDISSGDKYLIENIWQTFALPCHHHARHYQKQSLPHVRLLITYFWPVY